MIALAAKPREGMTAAVVRRSVVALYKIVIRKQFATEPVGSGVWTNSYHVTAANEDGALDIAAGLVEIERDITFETVIFLDYSARQDSVLAGSGKKRVLGVLGQRGAEGVDFLPTFNTVRATLTDGVARPDQKYLRLPLPENEQANGSLTPEAVAFYTDNYITPLLAYVGLVSSDGVGFTSGAIWPYVQMRQRNWSRRARPGFHRGYVPD